MRICIAIVMLATSSLVWAQEQSGAPRLLRADELKVSVDQIALQRQYIALRAMVLEAVEYSPLGPISNVVGQTGIVLPGNISGRGKGDSATDLLPLFDDLLLANGTEALSVRDNYVMFGSERGLELGQSIRGIPVVNGVVSISYNADTKRVSSIAAHFVPDRNLPHAPKLSAAQAQQIVRQALEITEGKKAHFNEGSHLAYFAEFGDSSPPQLVWTMRVVSENADEMFYVDSITGLVVSRESMSLELTRNVYDMNNSVLANFPQGLPAKLTSSQIATQFYRSSPHNYVADADAFLRVKIPNSIPEFPSTVNIVVRYGQNDFNTAWRLSGGQDYITLAGALSGSHTHAGLVDDSVVHEFAHGIGTRTFPYAGHPADRQWEGMHESYADAAATVVDVAKWGGPDILTWIMSDGLYTDGDGVRSMRNPYNDSLARFFAIDWYDHRFIGKGFQHYNSGIASHAYYLLVNGGRHARYLEPFIPDTVITALGESKTRNIFFNAFRNSSLNVNPDLPKLKGAAMAQALASYGSSERTQVKNAFEAVGVCKTAAVAPPAPTLQSIGDLLCAGRFRPIWDLITGATRYYAEVAPANLGWAFSSPVSDVDGETDSCFFRVTQPSLYRMMACNDCGCGPWSDTYFLDYWSPCP